MENTVTDNKSKARFELEMNGEVAFADYRREGSTLYITHVEAPEPLRGKGAADKLMRGLMEILRAEKDLTIVPTCSYAVVWMKRNKQSIGPDLS